MNPLDRADNFIRHHIERFRGSDAQWALYKKSRKGVRAMIANLQNEFALAISEAMTESGSLQR